MNWSNRFVKITMIMLCCLLTTGCWDYEPVETLLNVAGIAIDRSKQDPERLEVSVIGVDYAKTKLVLSAEGKSISDALNELQNMTSKRVILSHVQIIMFSESIAKAGLLSFMDLFFRDMQMRTDAGFAVVKGRAASFFEQKNFKYPVTGRTYQFMIKTSETVFSDKLFHIHYLMLHTTENYQHFALPYYKRDKSKKVIVFDGLSLMKNGKQVQKLNMEQLKVFMVLRRELQQIPFTYGKVNVDNPKSKSVTFRLYASKPKVKISVRNDKLHFLFRMKMNDEIVEVNPWRPKPLTHAQLRKIEHNIELQLEKQCKKLVTHMQREHGFDPFWLAEEARIQAPQKFDRNRWDEQFSEATFTFDIRIRLERYGQLF